MGRNNQQRRRARAAERRARRAAPTPSAASARGSMWSDPVGGSEPGPGVEEQAMELLHRGAGALHADSPGVAQEAAVQLAELSRSAQAQRRVASTVRAQLRQSLAEAWRRGWQPDDLRRLARRRLPAPTEDLFVDAIADEYARYAPGTVDPRWARQMDEMDARPWWPDSTTFLQARHEQRHVPWVGVLLDAMTVLQALWTLPNLERLLPLPGAADAGREPRRVPAAGVDDRILHRVRMMLTKAESTPFEAEADAFTAAAQSLMARHSIDAAMLAAEQPSSAEPVGRRIGLDNPYEAEKVMLLQSVAAANRCQVVWSKELGFATMVGFVEDLESVDLLFTSLLVQSTQAVRAAGTRTDRYGRSRTRAFRHSFLTGYATRIGERLRAATSTEVETARAEVASSGRDLVPVLAERDAQVEGTTARMFPALMQRSLGRVNHGEGWVTGRAAADRASIGPSGAVEAASGR